MRLAVLAFLGDARRITAPPPPILVLSSLRRLESATCR